MPIAAQRLYADPDDAPLEEILLSGGDARLALDLLTGLNRHGCAPLPRRDVDDFASTTASSISEPSLRRVEQVWRAFVPRGGEAAMDHLMANARRELTSYLGLGGTDTRIVFSSSGTDAQLLALFLVRALLGAPLVTIVVGSDQTGSGTAFTARGRCFSERAAGMKKDDAIEGLTDGVRSIAIPFCDPAGRPRSSTELDRAVTDAVETAVAQGTYVLLQAMASSKLGWIGPSDACLDALQHRWPQKLRIVVDACQMRIGSQRLKSHLARGRIVLATGSKYFCGPPFSGAVLLPVSLTDAIAGITEVPQGLKAHSSRFDWPADWPILRAGFTRTPNIGQWLRWEAALEEMRAYHAVPATFRVLVLRRFAEIISELIAAAPYLSLYSPADAAVSLDEEFVVPTIFSFLPRDREGPFTRARCDAMYRLLNGDFSPQLSARHSAEEKRLAARLCHIGQAVAVGPQDADMAVLRLSVSARLVARCWSPDPRTATARLQGEIEKIQAVIAKIELIARHFAHVAA